MPRLVAFIDSIEPSLENIFLLLPRCDLTQLRQKSDGLIVGLGARFLNEPFHLLPSFTSHCAKASSSWIRFRSASNARCRFSSSRSRSAAFSNCFTVRRFGNEDCVDGVA